MEILENLGIPYNINWTESKSVSIKINKKIKHLNTGDKLDYEAINSLNIYDVFKLTKKFIKSSKANLTDLNLDSEINELKKYMPELGGNATFVVMDDCDTEEAAKIGINVPLILGVTVLTSWRLRSTRRFTSPSGSTL